MQIQPPASTGRYSKSRICSPHVPLEAISPDAYNIPLGGKSKLFFSDYDRIALEPETQMKLTIKWVADCRGEPVPEIAANAETEALEVLERENTESSATKADKGQAQKDQEDHFQSSSDMVGRLGVSQTINQFLSRAGGALRSVHGRGTPIMAQPYGMRRPMVTW